MKTISKLFSFLFSVYANPAKSSQTGDAYYNKYASETFSKTRRVNGQVVYTSNPNLLNTIEFVQYMRKNQNIICL